MRARAFVASAVLSLTALSLVRCATPDEADYVGGEPGSSDATANDVNTSSDAIASGDTDVGDAGNDAAFLCVGPHLHMYDGGHCYSFVDSKATWDNAGSACVAWGGHLVEIDDYNEVIFLQNAMHEDYTVEIEAGDVSTFWTGLNNLPDGGDAASDYHWNDSGVPAAYTNFGGSSPTGKPCVVQYVGRFEPTWDDYMRNVPSPYVCERP